MVHLKINELLASCNIMCGSADLLQGQLQELQEPLLLVPLEMED